MLKPFANSTRATGGPLTWRTWVGLISLPVLVLGVLTWAFWAPNEDHGTARAAVVNDDEPVKVKGQLVPLGRELTGKLTHSDDSSYDWVLTDAEDARSGLDDGTYAAVVTIPKRFSAQTTSAITEKPLDATRAMLRIQTSANAGVADPAASREIAATTLDNLNQQVVESYLDGVYGGFTDIHAQVGKAAGGAKELAGGTGKLSSGAHELSGGAGKLDKAAKQLSSGAGELSTGTGQLVTGSDQLAGGLADAKRQTANLPEQTRKLSQGARQVADGNQAIADKVVPLADKVIKAVDALPSAKEAAQRFQQLADRCEAEGGDSQFCSDLDKAAADFTAKASRIDAAKTRIRKAAVDTKAAVQKLASGAEQVADGNAKLAASAPKLSSGISSAASGANELHSGATQADAGAKRLATGAGKLANGTSELSTSSRKLASGADEVDAGAGKLSTSLAKGRDSVPSYDKDERAHLKQVAAAPAGFHLGEGPSFGRTAIAVFVTLALWACALATYVITRAVPPAVLTSREPSWKIIARAALPGATAAVITATAVSLLLAPVLDLAPARWLAFLGVTLLAALAFVAINQSVVAIFKRPGRVASIAVLVLTVATAVVSTVPAFFASVGALLPTHGAILALRAVVTGADGVVSGVLQLVVWLAVGAVATIVVTDRRRGLSASRLRLRTESLTSEG